VNIQIETLEAEKRPSRAGGIDLSLKDLATLSTGKTIAMPAHYRRSEAQLAMFQRRGQRARTRARAAKVANQRKHFLREVLSKIVRDHTEIYARDVSAFKLAGTRMAKYVHDAGWAMCRNMLSYTSIATGAVMRVVSEQWTSRACSCCASIPSSTPKAMRAIGIRHWVCSDCGEAHDRDINAARNILRVGLERQPPAVEIPAL
jgi:putative transposase